VDTANYIDYDYATRMTRAAVDYLTMSAVLLQNNGDVPEPSCVVLLVVFAAMRLRRRCR
jgi:hypothetical protein